MGGYTPQARHGLIALLAARRVKAEKARRALAAKARTPEERALMSVDPSKGGLEGEYGHVLH